MSTPAPCANAAAPWLSILIPAYNAATFLPECLDSILTQTLPGVEVLVMNDASSDTTAQVLAQWAQRWAEHGIGHLSVLHHTDNQGLSVSRNDLLQAAQGRYLWFVDADDRLLPGVLARLHAIVAQHAPDLVLCDFQVWRSRPRLKHRLRGEQHQRTFDGPAQRLEHSRCALLTGLLRCGQLHAWSKVSHRRLWQTQATPAQPVLRFPAGRCFEDMTTMPQVALRAAHYFYDAQPWVAYRQHGASVLATMNLQKVQDQVAALIPVHQALQHSGCCAKDPAVQLALAQQSARSLQGAARFVLRQLASGNQPAAAQHRSLLAQLQADFAAASPLSATALLRAYLRQGWWWRALRWWRLQRALAAATGAAAQPPAQP